MTDLGPLSGLIFICAIIGFGAWFCTKFLSPLAKVHEYINWYKIGRVKQFAKEKNINIEETIAYEELRNRRDIQKAWTQKIEDKLSEELESVEKINDKPKK